MKETSIKFLYTISCYLPGSVVVLRKNSQTMFKKLFAPQYTVEDIHNSFDAAQDELLAEAQRILDGLPPVDDKKTELLKKLGFTATKQVMDQAGIIEEKQKQTKRAELVNYYKQTYPFLKFLTVEKLNDICKKYNLVYAPVSAYKDDVPMKNLLEIERAQPLSDRDTIERRRFVKWDKLWPHAEKRVSQNVIDKYYNKWLEIPFGVPMNSERDFMRIFKIEDSRFMTPVNGGFSVKTIDHSGLFIAAPLDHFDTNGLSKDGDFGYALSSMTKINDPIVFRYVRGGIQVLSKWGPEANDAELINPNDN